MQDKTNHKLQIKKQIKKQMISILGLLPNIAGRKMMTTGENPLAESQAHKMREKTSNSLEAMHDTIEDFANNCLVDGDKIIEWIKKNKDNVILTDTLLFKCVVYYINENNL